MSALTRRIGQAVRRVSRGHHRLNPNYGKPGESKYIPRSQKQYEIEAIQFVKRLMEGERNADVLLSGALWERHVQEYILGERAVGNFHDEREIEWGYRAREIVIEQLEATGTKIEPVPTGRGGLVQRWRDAKGKFTTWAKTSVNIMERIRRL